jgi:hypothetical protein
MRRINIQRWRLRTRRVWLDLLSPDEVRAMTAVATPARRARRWNGLPGSPGLPVGEIA